MAQQMRKKAEKQPVFDGLEMAETLYGDRPKKRKKRKVTDAKKRPEMKWENRKQL